MSLLAYLILLAEIHAVPYGAKLVITGHTFWVSSIAYIQNGKYIATGGGDGEIYIWDAGTGKFVKSLHKHTDNVADIKAVKGSNYLVSIGSDGLFVVWDVSNGKAISSTDMGEPLSAYAASNDGKYYAIGFESGVIVRYNASNGSIIDTLRIGEGAVTDMLFLPDNSLVVTSDEGRIKVFSPDGRSAETLLKDASATSVAYSGPRKLLAVGGSDGFLYFFDPRTLKEKIQPIEAHTASISALEFSGSTLISASADSTVKVWDIDRRAPDRTFTSDHGEIYALAVSPDGKRVAAGTDNGLVILWDVKANKLISVHGRQYGGWVTALNFTPDNRHIFSTGFNGVVHAWSTDDGTLLWENDIGEIITVSPDGKYLAAGGGRDSILVFDLTTGKLAAAIPTIGNLIFIIKFSPDGKYIAFGGMRRQLSVYRTSDWQPALSTSLGDKLGVRSCDFVGDKIVVGGFDGSIIVYDLNTGKEVRRWKGHDNAVTSLIYKDGCLFSTSRDGHFKIWDFKTGDLIKNIAAFNRNITSMAVLSNGAAVFTASLNGKLKVWNPGNGKLIKEISGYQDGISSLALSPDGRYVATGGIDGNIIIWEVDAILPK